MKKGFFFFFFQPLVYIRICVIPDKMSIINKKSKGFYYPASVYGKEMLHIIEKAHVGGFLLLFLQGYFF